MPSPCIGVVTRAGARRRLVPPANVADVTTTGYAAESGHARAGLMALIEETWCMLNVMTTGSDDLVNFDLSGDEREFLREGLSQWGGPAGCTEELAVAMGFDSVHDLLSETKRLVVAVSTGTPMSARDWARTLVCAEIDFASDVFGAGVEWETVTALSDTDSLQLLRSIQRKLVGAVHAKLGTRRNQFQDRTVPET